MIRGTEMKLTINDVLGIRHAEVEIEASKVVEVVGPNASPARLRWRCALRRCWLASPTR